MTYDPAAALAALASRAPSAKPLRDPAEDRPLPGKRYALSALVPTRANPAPTWADAELPPIEPQPLPADPYALPEGWEVTERENRRGPFYLVVGPRETRAAWIARIERAQRAGGWYSRRWGASPAGYGFPDRDAALAFARAEGGAA